VIALPRPDISPLVVGLQAGRPRELFLGGRMVRTAIAKLPVPASVAIGPNGLEGDHQADRRYHGGVERALCAYPAGHLAAWGRQWGVCLAPGCFGENLTISGLDEDSVHIGDRFRCGSALVEVSQPREPCETLAWRLGRLDLPDLVRLNGWTGWYMRVVEPGVASAGLPFLLDRIDPARVSVAEAYRVRLDTRGSRSEVRRLLAVSALSSGWRISLERRL
jgi:MOSC domain-containing protein YiiM